MANSWLTDAKRKLESMPTEAKQIRELAKEDLFFFAKLVNPNYMYGDIHKEVFNWLGQYKLFSGDDATSNKLVLLPRAHLKSHMVATATAWLITRHPEITILYLSATAELAELQLLAIQNIMASDVYQRYFPEYINPQEGKREKWNQRKFSIDHEERKMEGVRDPTVATAGLTTNTTGWHADVIVADDLVVPENAYTEDGRALVTKKSSQFTSIRNPGGFTIAAGTRYHPSDVYETFKNQVYEVFDDEGSLIDKKPVWSIKEYTVETDGFFLWPKVVRPSDQKVFGFDKNVLARIKGEYEDAVQFFAQYYNNPNHTGSNRISRDCFQYYNPKYLKRESGSWYYKNNRLNVYAAIDFAFSLSKAADNSAIVVIGIDCENNIFVLDIDLFKTDKISGYFSRIVDLHSRWDFKKLRAEVTVAQSIIVRDLKDKMKEEGLTISVDEFRPMKKEGSKEERIAAALEHRYENRQMWHREGGFTPILEEQLILARPKHDDCKDALASAVEIAVKPKQTRNVDKLSKDGVIFNSRFGGLSFRGY